MIVPALGIVASLMLTASALPAWATLDVQNDQMYLGDDGALHIVGELENTLSAPVTNARITAGIYSHDGTLLDSASSATLVRTIMPGTTTPFDIQAHGSIVSDAGSYELSLEYDLGGSKMQVIDIESTEIVRDAVNNLLIKGVVVNRGEITANAVSIVATLYDRQGNVATVSQAYATPDYLRAEDAVPFVIPIPDDERADLVSGYSLIAESEEYAPVPEFPAGSLLLLVGSVGGYVLLTRMNRGLIANLVAAADPR